MALNTVRPTAITASTAGTAQTIYTGAANGSLLRRMIINNVDTIDHQFTLVIVATAATTPNGTSDRLIGPITVPAGGFFNDVDLLGLKVNETVKIWADVGTSKLNFAVPAINDL